MKKIVTRMIAALLLLGGSIVPAWAQNQQAQYNSNAVGYPGFTLNASGSNYGQVFNVNGLSGTWALGAGSAQATNGSAVLAWNSSNQAAVGTTVPQASSAFEIGSTSAVRYLKNGWQEFHQNQVPTITSCGSSNSVATGTDAAGDVTIGSSASSSCTITFAEAPTNIPHCVCNNRTTRVPCNAAPTATTVVLTGSTTLTPFQTNDALDWVCFGHQ